MKEINFIEAVTERDIDLLILEELTVNDSFLDWFAGKVTGLKVKERLGAWHSITDKRFGESDLALVFQSLEDEKIGVLIENKIDALAQPDQCARYEERGKIGVAEKYWQKYFVCLIAPQKYLDTDSEATHYTHRVSYEEIAKWLGDCADARSLYKAKLMNEAIDQNRRGYTITPDERVSDFWERYYQYANTNYPELEMKKPGLKPSESDWPDFRPTAFKKKMMIVHKLYRGVVDLQIAGMGERLDELSDIVSSYLDDDIEIVKANKSAALRISVPVIDRFDSFDIQIEAVNSGFVAATRLLKLAQKINHIINK